MSYFILNLRQQGVNQKIMCYDYKDNNNRRFQPLIKLVYPSPVTLSTVNNHQPEYLFILHHCHNNDCS